ncbi:MAG: carboxypeptidase regulatory-like domain-containing protein [candidate division Zixibacteria bacterium]|nr:carboxypeptidase regulatory-like domain-containing protein [Candidatus Tariuqbacter arcticus]
MLKSVNGFIVILSMLILLVIGCSFDAERDNSLDPNSSDYQPFVPLSGKVARINSNIGIPDISLCLDPGSIRTLTDGDGCYAFQGVEIGDYTITLEHPEYKTMTDSLTILPGQDIVLNYQMDANPVIDSASVTSQTVVNNLLATDYDTRLYIYVNLYDPDGSSDLDDCQVLAFWEGNTDTLTQNIATVFDAILDTSDFPDNDIDNVLGIPFDIIMIDKYQDTTCAPQVQLRRVIDFLIEHKDPDQVKATGNVGGNPTFNWFPTQPLYFDYKYCFKIHYDDSEETLRYETVLYDTSEALVYDPAFNTLNYHLLEDTLNVNLYFWTVQLEDIYGNFTRSEESKFEVQ